MDEKHDAFICYNRHDRRAMEQIVEELGRAGLSVWYDQTGIPGGASWLNEIQTALTRSEKLVILLGPRGISEWQNKELQIAVGLNKTHLTIILPGVSDPEETANEIPIIGTAQWIDCRKKIGPDPIDEVVFALTGERTRFSQEGYRFNLEVRWGEGPSRIFKIGTLPNPDRSRHLDVTWKTFGAGTELLHRQIATADLDFDACFGINDAGLALASFLNSLSGRNRIGYIRQKSSSGGRARRLEREYCLFPTLQLDQPNILLVDFEIKNDDAPQLVTDVVREKYPKARIYLATFGALTDSDSLMISSIDELTAIAQLRQLDLESLFLAFTMHMPGIEPPFKLR